MIHWMCTNCGYYLQAISPLERCPGCNQACSFNNVTSYRREYGEGNIDPLLVGSTPKARAAAPPQVQSRPVLTMETLPPVHIFGSLTEEQRQRVRSLERQETYEANTIICSQGAEARHLYLVQEGQIAVECQLASGARIPIAVLSSTGAFGWSALVRPYQLTATVVALTRARVLAIERGALLGLMQADPRLGFLIMQDIASIMASRLRSLEQERIGVSTLLSADTVERAE